MKTTTNKKISLKEFIEDTKKEETSKNVVDMVYTKELIDECLETIEQLNKISLNYRDIYMGE